MKHTTNYNLNKIDLSDSPPDITALNPNFDTIDAELKARTDKDAEIVASIDKVKSDYLPKSGGNVTGNLTVKSKRVAVSVNGSTADANGNITIDVGGKVQSVNGVTPDANGNVAIEFGGGDVQSVDGVEPDAEGNVALNASTREEVLEAAERVTDVEVDASVAKVEALQTGLARVEASYLPLSGGNMIGTIVRNGFLAQNSVDNNLLVVRGGTDATSAFMALYGKNHASMGGVAGVVASKDSQSTGLYVYPNGYATLGGKKVVCVESWQSSDGTQWYRKYSDGLIEQGGYSTTESDFKPLTFPTPFSNNKYVIIGSISCSYMGSDGTSFTWGTRTTTTIVGRIYTPGASDTIYMMWYARGY